MMLEQLPRLIYVTFASYSLLLLLVRWRVTRVLTTDRRFLLAGLVLLFANSILSGVLKALAGYPTDVSSWGSVLSLSFLCAYLHYSLPAEYRRWHHRYSRRRR